MMRCAMFVDGWNFYWSLSDAGIKEYGWCDFALLARNRCQLNPGDSMKVKYFTAKDYNEERTKRQTEIWWTALRLLGIDVFEGEFRRRGNEPDPNERAKGVHKEKQTDIKLALTAITDLIQIRRAPSPKLGYEAVFSYEMAVILSGDSDFIPLARVLNAYGAKVRVLLPPNSPPAEKNIKRIWEFCHTPDSELLSIQVSRRDLEQALLPKHVEGKNGDRVTCYARWMWKGKEPYA